MPGASPTWSIAVLTFNRADVLERLLQELAPLQSDEVELIVVDNCSVDRTPDVVRTMAPNCTYLRMDRNLGVGARNYGLRRASSDLVVCLDDDVFGMDRPALETLRRAFDAEPALGGINFKVLDAFTGEICNWVHHRRVEDFADGTFDTYEITEGAVAFRKAAVEAAGYYPDEFFLSHEGPDLAFRMLGAGYRVIYRGDVVVHHSHANQGRQSWTSYYYDTRNRYWLAARNFPVGYAARYLIRGQLSTLAYAIRDGFVWHWARAVWHGVSGLPRVWRDRKIVSDSTMSLVREIEAQRAPLHYMVRKRLWKKGMRL